MPPQQEEAKKETSPPPLEEEMRGAHKDGAVQAGTSLPQERYPDPKGMWKGGDHDKGILRIQKLRKGLRTRRHVQHPRFFDISIPFAARHHPTHFYTLHITHTSHHDLCRLMGFT